MSEVQTKNIETLAYVVHDTKQPFKLETVVLDALRDNDVLVDIQYSGICHTDLVFHQGEINVCPYPAIFGHEGAGTIRAIGSKVKNKDLTVGDTVLLSINYCEECKSCKANHPAACIEGSRLHLFGMRRDGSTVAKLKTSNTSVRFHFFGQSSFAKMSFVDKTSIVKLPARITSEDVPFLAAVGCGAGTVMNILKPEPESSIVVFGLVTVGLTAIMAAKYMQVQQIIAVDIFDHKMPLALEVEATHAIKSRNVDDIGAHIKQLTGGKGADYTVDCTGVPAVIENMLNMLFMRGTAATVGVVPAGAKITIDPLAFPLGSRIYKGCREGGSNPPVYIPQLCQMQKDGHFPVEKLCRVYDYKDMESALHDLHEGKVTKPVIKWS